MQARKYFSKLNDTKVALAVHAVVGGLPRLVAYGLALGVVVGILALATRFMFLGHQSSLTRESDPTASAAIEEFSLVGLWAYKGQTCDEANSWYEFDGEIFWRVSSELRLSIGSYKVSQSDPIVFEQFGVKIPLLVSSNGNSIEPLGYDDPKKMFHLTRC